MKLKTNAATVADALDISFEVGNTEVLDSALEQGHRSIIYCDASSGYWVADLDDADETADEYLDRIAEECWPGEGGWPENDGEYRAWELAIVAREWTAMLVAGEPIERVVVIGEVI